MRNILLLITFSDYAIIAEKKSLQRLLMMDLQKFSEDSCDSLVEELILALLHTLDKLEVSNEQLISSGISVLL